MNLLLMILNSQKKLQIGTPTRIRLHSVAFLALVLLTLSPLLLAAAPSVSASLDRRTVALGESVTYSLRFQEAAPANAPALPRIDGVSMGGVGRSSQITMINRQTTRITSFDYNLTPERTGVITIPTMRINMNGTILTTPALALQVTKANPAYATTNLAFLRLVIPKKQVYVQEPFPVEMHLYWQNAQNVNIPELQADGFVLAGTSEPRQTKTQVGNRVFNVAIIKRIATAKTNGTFSIGPATSQLTLRIPKRRDQRDPFAIFGGSYQLRQTKVSSETASVQVLALPPNPPADFTGTVGQFSLIVQGSPTTLNVGDPITLKAQLRGRGSLESINLPVQSSWRADDFKTYPPTSTVSISDGLGLEGTKSFEQVVIPQNHEITVLPPLLFTYFDVNRRRYHTLSNAPIPLVVNPGTGSSAPPPSLTNSLATSNDEPPPPDDILHILPQMNSIPAAAAPLIARPWFLSLQSVPALVWFALLIIRKRNESLANNPHLRRSKEVGQKVKSGLKELEALAESKKSDEFFALLFRLLQEQLGERLDLPASAITESVITEKLKNAGLSEEAFTGLRDLFHLCNHSRYASGQSGSDLSELLPRVHSAFTDLQSVTL